jgi:hypothetical protein
MNRCWLACVLVGAAVVPVAGCGETSTENAGPVEGYVCGADGKTYSVEDATRGEHDVEHRGRCDEPMHCESPNDCFVGDECLPLPWPAAEGGSDADPAIHPSVPSDYWCIPGPTRCNCPGVFEPVCGGDGRNYINACEAACAGVGVRHGGYCEEPPGEGCARAGCSDHLCVEEGMDIASTCEWRPVYECYQQASCERQENGQCGFTPTLELVECLEHVVECYDDGDCAPGYLCEAGECRDDCFVETHIRNLEGECVPKCYGPEQCGDEQSCNAPDVCLQDPACPECDVCVGWCVPPPDECRPTGCNGEICASQDTASPCVALPEFACYQEVGVCEIQPWGECGWTNTPEFDECLAQFDCRAEGCDEGLYCGFCWISWECIPDGAVC